MPYDILLRNGLQVLKVRAKGTWLEVTHCKAAVARIHWRCMQGLPYSSDLLPAMVSRNQITGNHDKTEPSVHP